MCAKHLEARRTHGCIIAPSLRKVVNLGGYATFESVEGKFQFTRCIRQVEAPTLWLTLAKHILGTVETGWKGTMGIQKSSHLQYSMGRQRLGYVALTKACAAAGEIFICTTRKDGTWKRNLQVCGGQVRTLRRSRRT